jgi:tetratricopeptide (TPR) repeat protein
VLAPVAVLLFPSTGLAGGPGSRKQLANVERLLGQEQVAEAARLLAPLAVGAGAAAESPRALQLRAEILFLQGDYPRALEVAREAVRRAPAAGRARVLRGLITATAEAVKGYVALRSREGHFQIWTSPGKDELLAPFVGETLEACRREIKEHLGYAPPEVVRVEIYPRPEILSQVSPLTLDDVSRSGTIALSKYNRLMIVTPRALLRGYPWRDTLAHEYVHLVVSRLSHNNAPIWLHEGLAKFFEAAWRLPSGTPPPLSPTQEHLLAEALRARQLIRWEQMHPSMAKLPSQRAAALAFAEVQTAIEFVARRAGVAALRRMIDALRSGKSDWQALFAATGLARPDFDRGWRTYLRGLNLRRLSGLVPEELRFGKEPTKEERIAAVKEGKARKFLRLAEMLRTRGLTRAAIVEYQKARGLLGARDELVTNHLARAYLEISSPAQAISALLPVLEYYPDLPGPQATIGTAYLRSGDFSSAQRHLRAAFRINPFDPEIHCNLALALKSQAPLEATLHQSVCAKLER